MPRKARLPRRVLVDPQATYPQRPNTNNTTITEQQRWPSHRRPRGSASQNQMGKNRSPRHRPERHTTPLQKLPSRDLIRTCSRGHLAEIGILARTAEAGTCA
jgi:hypothetical protein